jgi:hypothetical protein
MLLIVYNINDIVYYKNNYINKYINEDHDIIKDAKDKMTELKSIVNIKGISALFKNATLLNFIYDISSFNTFNNLNYTLLIKQIIKYINNNENEELKKNILNTFHTFVYSINPSKLNEFNSYFNKLQEILKYKENVETYVSGNNTDYFH